MPWVVGIDEAGYGPNLGPLVMSSTAYWTPKNQRSDMWNMLAPAVRRPATEKPDERLVVGDSKQLYSPATGLGQLERSLWATLLRTYLNTHATLHSLLAAVSAMHLAPLSSECWYRGNTTLPVDMQDIVTAATLFGDVCAKKDVRWNQAHSVIVCAPRFNDLLDRWDTKAVVLGLGFAELVRAHRELADDDDLYIFVDKHGGRNYYSATLQEAFDDCMVVAREESRRRSVYEVVGASRNIQITFEPEADGHHFAVALASMLSKYLREVLMHEFNTFWQQHVPNLKPTAGYPGDARRFFRAIESTVVKLGITEHQIWRRR